VKDKNDMDLVANLEKWAKKGVYRGNAHYPYDFAQGRQKPMCATVESDADCKIRGILQGIL
jgi:hypothetical protein